jgi:hypothetical protein
MAQEIAEGGGLTLSQAARRFPPFRKGRPVSGSCVYRWCTTGARAANGQRVRLEARRVAGRLLTTAAAITRFIEAQQGQPQSTQPVPQTPSQRQRAAERAAAELNRIGI